MKKAFIWGTGSMAELLLNEFDVLQQYDVMGFIDNNKVKHNMIFKGKRVYEPEILLKEKVDVVFIFACSYEEIEKQIMQMIKNYSGMKIENWKYFYKQRILKRYLNSKDNEIKKILSYIREKDIQVFNYDFSDKYENMDVDVIRDSQCGLYYVWHKGKKMYFANTFDTEEAVRKYYISLLLEQDEESPHKYLAFDFNVNEGDVVIDAGVAEGNFSLEIIDKVSKVYMIEADIKWVEALKMTFKEYMDKVVIIPKFLSSINDGSKARIDSLVDEPVDFIKMDIEGYEWDALLGAENLIISSNRLKCAVCSYHSEYDETLIKDILKRYGMKCSTTPGYMWFPEKGRNSYISTKLCRGIVRGIA